MFSHWIFTKESVLHFPEVETGSERPNSLPTSHSGQGVELDLDLLLHEWVTAQSEHLFAASA